MPKKKKRGGQKDARGYSRTNNPKKKVPTSIAKKGDGSSASSSNVAITDKGYVAGKSKRQIKVSQKAQDEITSLLDKLKESLLALSSESSLKSEKKQTNIPSTPSMEDKKTVKKIAALNDALEDLGFSTEQILQMFVVFYRGELAHPGPVKGGNESNHTTGDRFTGGQSLTLDTALDWLCLHLPTKELPRLFTDTDIVTGGDEKLSVSRVYVDMSGGKNADGTYGGDTEINSNLSATMIDQDIAQVDDDVDRKPGRILATESRSQTEKIEQSNTTSDDDDAAVKKQWLLEQYQYEEDEENVEDEGGTETTVNEVPVEKSIEERRLERLESQIKEDRESLNDEAANYMRSKYEIADLKKRLKKAEQQAKGLRSKIEKKRAKESELAKAATMDDHDVSEDECYGGEGGMFDLFGTSENTDEQTAPTAVVDSVKNYVQPLSANIPNGWTGKTPKEILLEHCRKRKIPKPTFSKILSTQNGCIVRLKLKTELLVEHEGPFCTFKDGEQFASTKALYEMAPNLPLYQLLPPVFRDLWKSWISEKEAKVLSGLAKEDEERNKKITELIQSIQNALPVCEGHEDTQTSLETESLVKKEKDETEELGDWDEESWGDGSGDDHELAAEHQDDKMNIPSENNTNRVKASEAGMRMRKAFKRKENMKSYQDMKRIRATLPMFQYRQEFLETVSRNPVTVLCAETGAGKTTQCPQFLVEDAFFSGIGDKISVICTQPRRISALSVAERVAEEMAEKVGQHVGYHIRMETKKSQETKLMFCTTGVVLRRLQHDPNLTGVTHVIVDECHERQWQIDFLLIALRRLLQTSRRDLKVILMSATLDSQLFCSFFEGAPFLSIPGNTFPVSQYYLEDVLEATRHVIEEDSKYAKWGHRNDNSTSLWVTGRGGEKRRQVLSLESELDSLEVSEMYDGYTMSTRRSMEIVNEEIINYDLIEDLLTLILINNHQNQTIVPPEDYSHSTNGSILIFLPGLGEIRTLNDRLKANIDFGDPKRFNVIPMHSTLSPADQKRAFVKSQEGCRKIILSTNIAETSVTIADCVMVIDSGMCREVVQNKRSSTSTLVTGWCSRASAKQRAGRAGRVQPGICCKLYSSNTANVVMKKQSTPELQRVPLEEVCLNILAGSLSDNCMDFLLQAPQPPSQESVRNALRVLEEVGAIHPIISKKSERSFESITPLGYHLAKIPVHVRLGKMLIFGAMFKVLDKILTIVASISARSVFSTNIDHAQNVVNAHKTFQHPTSDFFTMCNVWDRYTSAFDISASNARKFCSKYFLSRAALIEISDLRKQFFEVLQSIGFVDSSKVASVKGLCSSSYNKHASREEAVNCAIVAGLFPNVAHCVKGSNDAAPNLFSRDEKLWFHKSSVNHNKKVLESEWVVFQEKFATGKTFVSTTGFIQPFTLLLFGNSIAVKHLERKVTVDQWIELNISAQVGVMFYEVKRHLLMLLKEKMDDSKLEKTDEVIDGIVRLLQIEARDSVRI